PPHCQHDNVPHTIAFIGVLLGAILGALLALMKLANSKTLRGIAIAYIEYVRGTPLLVHARMCLLWGCGG
ncbi:hypothetical protein OCL90_14835, partial [Enterococcus faecalis]